MVYLKRRELDLVIVKRVWLMLDGGQCGIANDLLALMLLNGALCDCYILTT